MDRDKFLKMIKEDAKNLRVVFGHKRFFLQQMGEGGISTF